MTTIENSAFLGAGIKVPAKTLPTTFPELNSAFVDIESANVISNFSPSSPELWNRLNLTGSDLFTGFRNKNVNSYHCFRDFSVTPWDLDISGGPALIENLMKKTGGTFTNKPAVAYSRLDTEGNIRLPEYHLEALPTSLNFRRKAKAYSENLGWELISNADWLREDKEETENIFREFLNTILLVSARSEKIRKRSSSGGFGMIFNDSFDFFELPHNKSVPTNTTILKLINVFEASPLSVYCLSYLFVPKKGYDCSFVVHYWLNRSKIFPERKYTLGGYPVTGSSYSIPAIYHGGGYPFLVSKNLYSNLGIIYNSDGTMEIPISYKGAVLNFPISSEVLEACGINFAYLPTDRTGYITGVTRKCQEVMACSAANLLAKVPDEEGLKIYLRNLARGVTLRPWEEQLRKSFLDMSKEIRSPSTFQTNILDTFKKNFMTTRTGLKQGIRFPIQNLKYAA